MRRTVLLPILLAVSGVTCSAPFSVPTALIVISDGIEFSPDTVFVTRGTTVEWKNESTQYHLVQGDSFPNTNLQEFPLAPVGGTNFEYPATEGSQILTNSGTYPYHCSLHPQMHGVVIVR